MNIDYQIKALNSLRAGIEQYDRRRGWRGVITNTYKNKNWKKTIKNFKLDPTLKWKFAEIIDLNNSEIKFKLIDNKKTQEIEILSQANLKWAIKKNKNIEDTFKIGDIIVVKLETGNWKLILYP